MKGKKVKYRDKVLLGNNSDSKSEKTDQPNIPLQLSKKRTLLQISADPKSNEITTNLSEKLIVKNKKLKVESDKKSGKSLDIIS